MGKDVRFKPDWKNRQDALGDKCSTWMVESTAVAVKCKLCESEVTFSRTGFAALTQHSDRQKHRTAVNNLKATLDLNRSRDNSGDVENRPVGTKQTTIVQATTGTLSIADQVANAEARLACFTAAHDIPFNSAAHLPFLVRAMCPDSKIATGLKCDRTKSNYIITDGIAPEFHKMLCEKLRGTLFSLMIDESNKTFGKKFLNIIIRFFDNDLGRVIVAFLGMVVVNVGKAENITNAVAEQILKDALSWDHLMQVMSDNPSVMRGVHSGVQVRIKKHAPHLMDIGGCSLHIVHNGVSYAITELLLIEEAEELCQDLHTYWQRHPDDNDDFKELVDALGLKHTQFRRLIDVRFLCILPAVSVVIDQLEPLQMFFRSPKMLKKANVPAIRRITLAVADKKLITTLHIVKFALQDAQQYEKLFQKAEPTIHLVFDEQVDLCRKILYRFCKPELVQALENAKDFFDFDAKLETNHLPDIDIDMGSAAKEALMKVDSFTSRALIRRSVRDFYARLYTYLKTRFQLDNQLLADLRFLSPNAKTLTPTPVDHRALVRIAKALPPVSNMNDHSVFDSLRSEWYSYRADKDIPESWDKRIDLYWAAVSKVMKPTGELKYQYLGELAKCCLTFSVICVHSDLV